MDVESDGEDNITVITSNTAPTAQNMDQNVEFAQANPPSAVINNVPNLAMETEEITAVQRETTNVVGKSETGAE